MLRAQNQKRRVTVKVLNSYREGSYMKKLYEEYLIFEIRDKNSISRESLESIRNREVDGVMNLQMIPKDAGVYCFWNHSEMLPLSAWMKENVENNEKEWIRKLNCLMEVFQRIEWNPHLSMNGILWDTDAVYVTQNDNTIYVPVLPINDPGREWEDKLKEFVRDLIEKGRWSQTPLAQAVESALAVRVTPENLCRNIQLLMPPSQPEAIQEPVIPETKYQENRNNPEKQEEQHAVSTEELDWSVRMEKSEETGAVPSRDGSTESATENGVFFRKFKEKPEEPVEQAVSGRPDPQPPMDNVKKDTQVLRKNMLNTGNIGKSSGFSSVAPMQLNQKKESGALHNSKKIKEENPDRQLHFVSFGGSNQIDITINKSYFVLGKWTACVDGVINYTSTISRTHCAIHKSGADIYIEDLGSANGTFVNDKKLTPYEGVKITPKDVIRLAQERFAITYR